MDKGQLQKEVELLTVSAKDLKTELGGIQDVHQAQLNDRDAKIQNVSDTLAEEQKSNSDLREALRECEEALANAKNDYSCLKSDMDALKTESA